MSKAQNTKNQLAAQPLAHELAIAVLEVDSRFLHTHAHELAATLQGLLLADEQMEASLKHQLAVSPSLLKGFRASCARLTEVSQRLRQHVVTGAIDVSQSHQTVSLVTLLRETLGVHMDAAAAKGLTVTLSDDIRQDQQQIDVIRTRRALSSLLQSAIAHSQDGTIDVSVTQSEEDHLSIAVRDSSYGKRDVGGAFVRDAIHALDVGRQHLALAKSLAHVMGGQLTVHESRKEGMTATLRVPIAEPAQ